MTGIQLIQAETDMELDLVWSEREEVPLRPRNLTGGDIQSGRQWWSVKRLLPEACGMMPPSRELATIRSGDWVPLPSGNQLALLVPEVI